MGLINPTDPDSSTADDNPGRRGDLDDDWQDDFDAEESLEEQGYNVEDVDDGNGVYVNGAWFTDADFALGRRDLIPEQSSDPGGSTGVRDQDADVADGPDETTGEVNPELPGASDDDPNARAGNTGQQVDGDPTTQADRNQAVQEAQQRASEAVDRLKSVASVGAVVALVVGAVALVWGDG